MRLGSIMPRPATKIIDNSTIFSEFSSRDSLRFYLPANAKFRVAFDLFIVSQYKSLGLGTSHNV